MTDIRQAPTAWRTSSASNGGACVEVACTRTAVHVRDSMNREGKIISLPPSAWQTFLAAVRIGQSGSK